jgi:hypothetical protein
MTTLEEITKSKAFEFKVDYKPFETDLDYREYAEHGFEKGFIDGAKWQAERSYSEENLKKAIDLARVFSKNTENDGYDEFEYTPIEIVQQFKNKTI